MYVFLTVEKILYSKIMPFYMKFVVSSWRQLVFGFGFNIASHYYIKTIDYKILVLHSFATLLFFCCLWAERRWVTSRSRGWSCSTSKWGEKHAAVGSHTNNVLCPKTRASVTPKRHRIQVELLPWNTSDFWLIIAVLLQTFYCIKNLIEPTRVPTLNMVNCSCKSAPPLDFYFLFVFLYLCTLRMWASKD